MHKAAGLFHAAETGKDILRLIWIFDQLNQDFSARWRGDEEKIHASAICAGPRLRIDRLEAKAGTNQLRGPVDIFSEEFDLLDAFAEFHEETGNRAARARLASREDIEVHVGIEMPFKFLGVLIGRDIGKSWIAERGVNFRKMLGRDSDSDRAMA